MLASTLTPDPRSKSEKLKVFLALFLRLTTEGNLE